jgi:hypothetical protein
MSPRDGSHLRQMVVDDLFVPPITTPEDDLCPLRSISNRRTAHSAADARWTFVQHTPRQERGRLASRAYEPSIPVSIDQSRRNNGSVACSRKRAEIDLSVIGGGEPNVRSHGGVSRHFDQRSIRRQQALELERGNWPGSHASPRKVFQSPRTPLGDTIRRCTVDARLRIGHEIGSALAMMTCESSSTRGSWMRDKNASWPLRLQRGHLARQGMYMPCPPKAAPSQAQETSPCDKLVQRNVHHKRHR